MTTNFAIRTNNADLVRIAQKARSTQKSSRTPKTDKTPIYGPPVPNGHELDMLHKLVGKVQEDHNRAIYALGAYMDNKGESPIEVHAALKGTFGARLPIFTKWIREA